MVVRPAMPKGRGVVRRQAVRRLVAAPTTNTAIQLAEKTSFDRPLVCQIAEPLGARYGEIRSVALPVGDRRGAPDRRERASRLGAGRCQPSAPAPGSQALAMFAMRFLAERSRTRG